MNKGREFWIDRREHSGHRGRAGTGRFTAWNRYKFTSNGSMLIHVIEYQAYKKALQTLKEISLSSEFIHGYGEVPTESAKKALETLKELGEHE